MLLLKSGMLDCSTKESICEETVDWCRKKGRASQPWLLFLLEKAAWKDGDSEMPAASTSATSIVAEYQGLHLQHSAEKQ